MIKPRKHQRLADPLLQSGVVTRNNRVMCAITLSILLGHFCPKPLALQYGYVYPALKSSWDETFQY